MKVFRCAALIALTLLLGISGSIAETVEDAVYSLLDGQGNVIAHFAGDCEVGDEYISGDNQYYRVIQVDEQAKTALMAYLGEADLPDVSWLDADASLPVSATSGSKKIALYCTHSDESYKIGDGKTSDEERGGIYDVAAKLAASFEELGVTVEQSTELHHPNDAGAYRRSRQTAVALLKGTPNAIFDIHRDGIPDPVEYAVVIGDVKMSKVRLRVGKGNQNKDANLSLAKQIKAVADKVYPKLIKDIYMGKGSYNQDLSPRSVLLEFGTYTLPKERVLASTGPMSEVIYKALYGSVTGAAGASDVSGRSASTDSAQTQTAQQEDNKSAGSGIVWLVVALVVGLLLFAFLAGGKDGMNKFKRSFSEMTGGLFGKKPPQK